MCSQFVSCMCASGVCVCVCVNVCVCVCECVCACVCVKAREGQLSRYTERKKGGREANRAYLASEVPHSLCDEPSEHLSRGCQAPAKVSEAQRLLGVRARDYQRSALSRGLRVQRECVPDLTIVVCHLLAVEQAPRRAPSVNDHLSRRFEGLPLRHHSCPRRARCPQFVCLVRPTPVVTRWSSQLFNC